MITQLVGGIGLFLLGMVLLTDGLKQAAGEALRGVLVRVTGGPLRALLSGAAITALLQSSTATVLMTIGFVSAGLIGFTGAVAVVFGANVGTTSTGWIVALLGLKLSVGSAALPAIAAGALLKLLARDRLAAAGLALAGFGLIFTGIDLLQLGMQGVAERFEPAAFPGGSIATRLLLVGIGVAMTVVMQSSSAAVAATLTALHSGAIGLEQAAALVVGQNIGTTVTAAIAGVGASVPARRTATAHILFNILTGIIAFSVIPLVLRLETALWPGDGIPDAALLIAAFHTTFNVLGVLVLLPFLPRFAALVVRLVPERGPDFTRHLDPTVAQVPAVAGEAARRAVMEVSAGLIGAFRGMLREPQRTAALTRLLDRADTGLDEVRHFLARAGSPGAPRHAADFLSVLHAVEHLERLIERLRAWPSARAIGPDFRQAAALAPPVLEAAESWLRDPGSAAGPAEPCRILSEQTAAQRKAQRETDLHAAAAGDLDPDVTLRRLDAMRWLDSSIYHIWRAVHHITTRQPDTQTEAHD